MGTLKLYYESPAKVWEETLPVGNGSLGGMIFGGIQEEIIWKKFVALFLKSGVKKRND